MYGVIDRLYEAVASSRRSYYTGAMKGCAGIANKCRAQASGRRSYYTGTMKGCAGIANKYRAQASGRRSYYTDTMKGCAGIGIDLNASVWKTLQRAKRVVYNPVHTERQRRMCGDRQRLERKRLEDATSQGMEASTSPEHMRLEDATTSEASGL